MNNNNFNATNSLSSLQVKPNKFGKTGRFFGFLRTLSLIYSTVACLAIIGVFFYAFVLMIIIFCSLFTLLASPAFMALFDNGDQAIALCQQLFNTLPIGAVATIIFSIISSIVVKKDINWIKVKSVKNKNTVAIVISVVYLIIFGVVYWLIVSGNLTFG